MKTACLKKKTNKETEKTNEQEAKTLFCFLFSVLGHK